MVKVVIAVEKSGCFSKKDDCCGKVFLWLKSSCTTETGCCGKNRLLYRNVVVLEKSGCCGKKCGCSGKMVVFVVKRDVALKVVAVVKALDAKKLVLW